MWRLLSSCKQDFDTSCTRIQRFSWNSTYELSFNASSQKQRHKMIIQNLNKTFRREAKKKSQQRNKINKHTIQLTLELILYESRFRSLYLSLSFISCVSFFLLFLSLIVSILYMMINYVHNSDHAMRKRVVEF